MDSLVVRISKSIRDVIGQDIDLDQFELEMTKLLRKVDMAFQEIGLLFYRNEGVESKTWCRDPYSEPYKYRPPPRR